MKQFLVQMAGDSGTGKSTLSRAVAHATSAVVLDKDVYKAAMLEDGLGEPANGQAYVALFATAGMLMEQGFSVVLDSPAYFPSIRERGQQLAESHGAAYRIFETVCSDRALQDERLRTRERREFQPASLVEAQAMATRPGITALAERHRTIDTARPLDVCLAEALVYLEEDVP